jgi:hypothetical protein
MLLLLAVAARPRAVVLGVIHILLISPRPVGAGVMLMGLADKKMATVVAMAATQELMLGLMGGVAVRVDMRVMAALAAQEGLERRVLVVAAVAVLLAAGQGAA